MTSVDRVGYTFANNGNLLTTGALTNTWDAANRLIETTRAGTTLQPSYDGLGNRVGQTAGLSTTYFALDVQGLPEVISTSEGSAYLHLAGVIVAENGAGERRYLLPDGLGSVRQATDESGVVVAYHAFDPYGNPVANGGEPYGYTGEWWKAEVGLLYLRARWYLPEDGVFLSRDPVEGEPPYAYVRGNPVTLADPSGQDPCTDDDPFTICHTPPIGGGSPTFPPTPISTAPQPSPPIPVPDSRCTGAPYVECVPPPPPPSPRPEFRAIEINSCEFFEWFSAPGYAEGGSQSFTLALNIVDIWGEEVVYDFATMERATFTFEGMAMFPGLGPGYGTGVIDYTWSPYYVDLHSFENWKDIEGEYKGRFDGATSGASFGKFGKGVGIGSVYVWSSEMYGLGGYEAVSLGVSLPVPPIRQWVGSWFATNYTLKPGTHQEYRSGGNVDKNAMQRMKDDLLNGTYTPPFYRSLFVHRWGRPSAGIDLERTWHEHAYFYTYAFGKFRKPLDKDK